MNDVQTDAWGGKKIRAAIIEDELPAARLLQGMLADRNACPYRKRFLVNGARSLYTLAVDDVCYFYSEEKVTFAVTADRVRTSSTCRLRSWKSSSTRAASFVSAASSSFRLIASATSSLTSTARWWCTSRLPLTAAFR